MTDRWALVKDGEILTYSEDAPNVDQSLLAEGKPRWLPVEVTDPEFDSATQVRSGPVVTILTTKVKEVYSVRAKTLAERRDAALPLVAAKRWEVETGGTLAMGVPIRTDEVGQSKLTGVIVAFDNNPAMAAVDYEAQPGVWVDLDGPTAGGLGVLVAGHVQACFSRARVVSEAIVAASTHAEMDEAIAEIATGWPE